MPWIIDSLTNGIDAKHLTGPAPGGVIRAVASRRIITSNEGAFVSTENQFSGNPPELVGIVEIQDSYSFPSTKSRVTITRGPTTRFVPSSTSIGFVIGETSVETYSYRGIFPSQDDQCLTDIRSGTLNLIVVENTRLLGSLSEYRKYLVDRGQNPNDFALLLTNRVVTSFTYDAKGRTTAKTESTYEDPRALAGSLKGIDWTTTIVSGLLLTREVIETWREVRIGDWEYTRLTFEAWCRAAPNAIPSGTSLIRQIQPVLVDTLRGTSTSQNQPPAAERSPAQFSEDSRIQRTKLYFEQPGAPFTVKERTYTFDLFSGSGGGLDTEQDGDSLYNLGLLAGQREYGEANQVEIVASLSDEWFTYKPYQSLRLTEPHESGVYAISNATFVCDSTEFVASCRGLLVAVIDTNDGVIRPYTQPSIELEVSINTQPAILLAHLGGQTIGMMVYTEIESAVLSVEIENRASVLQTSIVSNRAFISVSLASRSSSLIAEITTNNASLSVALNKPQNMAADITCESAILSGQIVITNSLIASLNTENAELSGVLGAAKGLSANIITGPSSITSSLWNSALKAYIESENAFLSSTLYIAMSSRFTTTYTTGSLSTGDTETAAMTLSGKTVGIYYISTNRSCTVRVYGNSYSSMLDTRTILTNPVPDGVLLIAQASPTPTSSATASSVALGVNTDDSFSFPIKITNNGASGSVTISVSYLALE